MELKMPTAYIVVPHWTSWRTCSTVPSGFRWGAFAGMVVTGPAGDTTAGLAAAGVTLARHRAAPAAEDNRPYKSGRRMGPLHAGSAEHRQARRLNSLRTPVPDKSVTSVLLAKTHALSAWFTTYGDFAQAGDQAGAWRLP